MWAFHYRGWCNQGLRKGFVVRGFITNCFEKEEKQTGERSPKTENVTLKDKSRKREVSSDIEIAIRTFGLGGGNVGKWGKIKRMQKQKKKYPPKVTIASCGVHEGERLDRR